MAIRINDACELKNKLAQACNKLVVIHFFVPWCHSSLMGPQLDDIVDENSGSIVVLTIELDDCPDIAASYGVRSVPWFVFIKRSKVLCAFPGGNIDKLKKTIARLK